MSLEIRLVKTGVLHLQLDINLRKCAPLVRFLPLEHKLVIDKFAMQRFFSGQQSFRRWGKAGRKLRIQTVIRHHPRNIHEAIVKPKFCIGTGVFG